MKRFVKKFEICCGSIDSAINEYALNNDLMIIQIVILGNCFEKTAVLVVFEREQDIEEKYGVKYNP